MIKIIFKNRFFHVFIVLAIIIITAISNLDSFVELPSRPVREYATMTMALNPDKTESVRLKIPWGYLAPDISYMSAKDQSSFFAKAKAMMLLMGLSEVSTNSDIRKDKAKSLEVPSTQYTTAYSLDVLYPTFEAKNEKNIDLFISKPDVLSKVIQVTIYSSAKGYYWNNWRDGMSVSFKIKRESLARKLSKSKTFKDYGFAITELPSMYGLRRIGLSDKDAQRLRSDGFIEGLIPKDLWENRSVKNELESFMHCMRPDKGWSCVHTMYIPEINANAELLYHSSLLKHWQYIESETRLLFKKFIELGKEHNNG